jgi:ubiquinone/menaquinone biosynthesis C-methylase UbiE
MLKWRKHQNATLQGFARADSKRLPFDASSFDVILSTWMFSHIMEPSVVIQEAQRLLRPDGKLIVACFTRTIGWTQVFLRRIESLFMMRCVLQEEIQTWPGLKEVKTFAGGWNAVVCLRKES